GLRPVVDNWQTLVEYSIASINAVIERVMLRAAYSCEASILWRRRPKGTPAAKVQADYDQIIGCFLFLFQKIYPVTLQIVDVWSCE
ncbi:5864_t:CDS:2, partial [Ambispora gerdemannii]